jgi:hypothetical protein
MIFQLVFLSTLYVASSISSDGSTMKPCIALGHIASTERRLYDRNEPEAHLNKI